MSKSDEEERGMQLGYDKATYGFGHDDLEALGERGVRDKLNSGGYGYSGLQEFIFISAWLADKDFARRERESQVRDQREKITLRAAKIANLLAIVAIIISIISLVAGFNE